MRMADIMMRPVKTIRNLCMRSKLLLTYLLVVLLPVLLIGYFLVSKTIDAAIKQTNDIVKINSRQVRSNINNKLNGYLEISDSIITDRRLVDSLQMQYSSESEYLNYYVEYLQVYSSKAIIYNPDHIKISIYTSNKTVIPDYKLIETATEEIKSKQWYKDILKANGGNVISSPSLNNSSQMTFVIGRVLNLFASQKNQNILAMEIPEEQIYELIKKEQLYKDIYLLNGDGVVMSSTDRESIGRMYTQVGILGENIVEEHGLKKAARPEDNSVILMDFGESRGPVKTWHLVCIVSSEVFLSKIREIVQYSTIICLVSILAAISLIFLFSNKLSSRIKALADNMKAIRHDRLDVVVDDPSEDEIGEMTRSFKDMINRINRLISEVYVANMNVKDLQIKKKEAELNALQSQMNPHFMFNTMHSIQMNLIKKGDFETSDIIQNFAELLRKSITWGEDMIALKQELDLVDNYLKIQKFRYGKKLDYRIEIEEDLLSRPIPKFTLQPIVENAIYHGIERKEGKGFLYMYGRVDEDAIQIIVEDDGVGIDEERLLRLKAEIEDQDHSPTDGREKKSIGLINVHQRLSIYYGSKYGISISSQQCAGTRVTVRLPLGDGKGEA